MLLLFFIIALEKRQVLQNMYTWKMSSGRGGDRRVGAGDTCTLVELLPWGIRVRGRERRREKRKREREGRKNLAV